jgi:hypothetical protein
MYPGELERKRCAERTRADLIEYAPTRPISGRDEVRLRWQQDRCGTCRACPMLVRALGIMLPAVEPPSAIVLKLAS